MIEINLGTLHKGEKKVSVKGHQTKTGYVKPYIRVIKTGGQKDTEEDSLQIYKEAAAKTNDWMRSNPDRNVDIGNTSDYTVGTYEFINEALRDGLTEAELSGTSTYDQIKSISSFLKDAPKFNGTTYRGLSFFMIDGFDAPKHDEFMKSISGSESISLPSFTSTSVDKEVATKFMPKHRDHKNILLEIKSKYGVALNGVAEFTKEREVLFDKNSEFKIINVEEIDGIKHIKLEEI